MCDESPLSYKFFFIIINIIVIIINHHHHHYIIQEVEGSLDHRISALEAKFNTYVSKHMSDMELSLDQSVKHKIRGIEDVYVSKAQQLHEELKVEKGAWMIPFLILVVLMIGGAVGVYLFYEKMRKMHLL